MSPLPTRKESWEQHLSQLAKTLSDNPEREVVIEWSRDFFEPLERCTDLDEESYFWRFLDLAHPSPEISEKFRGLPFAARMEMLKNTHSYIVLRHDHGDAVFFLSGDPCPVCGTSLGMYAGALFPPVYVFDPDAPDRDVLDREPLEQQPRDMVRIITDTLAGATYTYVLFVDACGVAYQYPFAFHTAVEAVRHARETCERLGMQKVRVQECIDEEDE